MREAGREVRDELREDRALRTRVDDHERRIGALEKGREAAHGFTTAWGLASSRAPNARSGP